MNSVSVLLIGIALAAAFGVSFGRSDAERIILANDAVSVALDRRTGALVSLKNLGTGTSI